MGIHTGPVVAGVVGKRPAAQGESSGLCSLKTHLSWPLFTSSDAWQAAAFPALWGYHEHRRANDAEGPRRGGE